MIDINVIYPVETMKCQMLLMGYGLLACWGLIEGRSFQDFCPSFLCCDCTVKSALALG